MKNKTLKELPWKQVSFLTLHSFGKNIKQCKKHKNHVGKEGICGMKQNSRGILASTIEWSMSVKGRRDILRLKMELTWNLRKNENRLELSKSKIAAWKGPKMKYAMKFEKDIFKEIINFYSQSPMWLSFVFRSVPKCNMHAYRYLRGTFSN